MPRHCTRQTSILIQARDRYNHARDEELVLDLAAGLESGLPFRAESGVRDLQGGQRACRTWRAARQRADESAPRSGSSSLVGLPNSFQGEFLVADEYGRADHGLVSLQLEGVLRCLPCFQQCLLEHGRAGLSPARTGQTQTADEAAGGFHFPETATSQNLGALLSESCFDDFEDVGRHDRLRDAKVYQEGSAGACCDPLLNDAQVIHGFGDDAGRPESFGQLAEVGLVYLHNVFVQTLRSVLMNFGAVAGIVEHQNDGALRGADE